MVTLFASNRTKKTLLMLPLHHSPEKKNDPVNVINIIINALYPVLFRPTQIAANTCVMKLSSTSLNPFRCVLFHGDLS